jgi:enterochelin esterase family protein
MILRSVLIVTGLAVASFAQTTRIISPEIHPDRRVTLRLRAPNAKDVLVAGELTSKPQAMMPGSDGVWSVTLGPLEPDIYGYSFRVDGTSINDPHNATIKAGVNGTQSLLTVPGETPAAYDGTDVPHGILHRHYYRSAAVDDRRSFVVYTPPRYFNNTKTKYPVLYLLHGSGDLPTSWTETGRAHFILDNLIAAGAAKPMLVVMPFGHTVMQRSPDSRQRNVELFAKDLLESVIPIVESHYNVLTDRKSRAIAGLSIGGGQALWTGSSYPEQFRWVAGFSSSVPQNLPVKKTDQFRWIAIGRDDFLLENNRKLEASLKAAGVQYSYKETAGAHSWRVWRRYLAELVPLLFR